MKRMPEQKLNQRDAKKFIGRIEEAVQGLHGPDQAYIAQAGLEILDTLLRKNTDYGSSAWNQPLLAPDLTPEQGMRTRMSDKVSRLNGLLSGNKAQVDESVADTFLDLAGYSILYVAYGVKQAAESQRKETFNKMIHTSFWPITKDDLIPDC